MLLNKLTLFPILIMIILLYARDEIMATIERKNETNTGYQMISIVPSDCRETRVDKSAEQTHPLTT